jgi:hypothetical protein
MRTLVRLSKDSLIRDVLYNKLLESIISFNSVSLLSGWKKALGILLLAKFIDSTRPLLTVIPYQEAIGPVNQLSLLVHSVDPELLL